eukprot:1492247-Rhodomonas_salina.2
MNAATCACEKRREREKREAKAKARSEKSGEWRVENGEWRVESGERREKREGRREKGGGRKKVLRQKNGGERPHPARGLHTKGDSSANHGSSGDAKTTEESRVLPVDSIDGRPSH